MKKPLVMKKITSNYKLQEREKLLLFRQKLGVWLFGISALQSQSSQSRKLEK